MNTSELNCLLTRALRNTPCRFLGVFAADEAPTELPRDSNSYPCAFVINTDVASEPGHHWVACYVASPKSVVEFFDSYGNLPAAYPNLRVTAMSRRIRRWSTVSFQSSHWFVVITVFFTFADVRLVGRRHTLETYFCALLLLVRLALYTRKTV
jgi:hypothetical protein